MIKFFKQEAVFLVVVFFLLQLAGQTAAGFSGRAEGLFNIFTALSYFCLISRSFVWMLILKKMPLTKAYPLTATIYILILPLSIFVFSETPDWSNIIGAVLIFSGISVFAVGTVKNV